MKDTFFRLNEEKQERLIDACIREFAEFNYSSASINRIIKEAGISKGGLFKYIENKSDLYMFVVARILESLICYQVQHIETTKTCYFDRIEQLLESGFAYYKERPLDFKVVMNGMMDMTSPNYQEVMSKRTELIKTYQKDMLSGIDWGQYNRPKEDVLQFSAYVLDGYNVSLLRKLSQNSSLEAFESINKQEIKLIMSVLRQGLKGGSDD